MKTLKFKENEMLVLLSPEMFVPNTFIRIIISLFRLYVLTETNERSALYRNQTLVLFNLNENSSGAIVLCKILLLQIHGILFSHCQVVTCAQTDIQTVSAI